jgi:hypothetical protein
VQEKEMQIERGLTAHIMAFNGSIPGPIVVVYQYDYHNFPSCSKMSRSPQQLVAI